MMIKTKLRRHDRPWSPHDLKKLRKYAEDELSAVQAAKKLGRSTGAVKYKAMTERVRFRAINQPRNVQKRNAPKLRRLRLARLIAAARGARGRARIVAADQFGTRVQ